jgi:endonuclease/exonuclease/phosphatase family metal-dependent hydrolase
MKPGLAVAAIWLLLAGAGVAETLRIATFNVENYGPANRMTAAGYRKDYPKPEAAKRALRTILREIAADVVVLQEMGPRPYLDELRRDLRSEGLDYAYAEHLAAEDDARHVAVLSRVPLRMTVRHADLTFKYFGETVPVRRGLLEVTVAAPGGEVTLWALHLKSRFTERSDDPGAAKFRGGEATAIRNRVLERFPRPEAARFIILGDFNDGKNSTPLRYMQKRGRLVIARLLPAADSRGETWTSVFRREETYSRVDHILVSPALLPQVMGGRAVIHDSPSVMQASDHRPVYIMLKTSADSLVP